MRSIDAESMHLKDRDRDKKLSFTNNYFLQSYCSGQTLKIASLTPSVPGKLKNLIFENPKISETLIINN